MSAKTVDCLERGEADCSSAWCRSTQLQRLPPGYKWKSSDIKRDVLYTLGAGDIEETAICCLRGSVLQPAEIKQSAGGFFMKIKR